MAVICHCGNSAAPNDYLCDICRISTDPRQWDDRYRCYQSVGKYLQERKRIYYGMELFFPEDSQWAWLRILDEASLADPEALTSRGDYIGSQAIMQQYMDRIRQPMLVVWKATGDIYRLDADSTVPDDPIWDYSTGKIL